jgi:hypothetical protein
MSKNMTIHELPDGRRICKSYGVSVAAFVPGRGYVKTDHKYSVTTSKHANQFCEGRGQVVHENEFRDLIGDPQTEGGKLRQAVVQARNDAKADRIAVLSTVYPDLTVEQLEQIDKNVRESVTAILR